uniref:Uncharacterized protein n=2 Tax=Ditylum brightwellii TaxID=49249 RepID=A0A7S2EB04_9STRA|mmetsp:Transcript_22413/g.33368  ORF Transcript_22413/g.33368 Transcript_22413/m.33368 type:complete len:626 (+) Transcript_22413:209-2086(+)
MDLANKGEQHTSPDRQSLTTSNSDRSPQWKSPSFVSRIMKSRSRSTDGMLESTPTNDSKRKVTISDDPAEVLGPASPERQYTDAENPSIQSPPMTSSLGYGDDLFEDEMTPEGMRWQMEDEELNYHPSRSDLRATPTKEEAGMERASPREDRFNGEEPYANHYPTPGKKNASRWCPMKKKCVSWQRMSSIVVRNAPCFWCCAHPLETSATDRAVLTRLNILCAFFAAVQVGVGLFLILIRFQSNSGFEETWEPYFWNVLGNLYFLAFVGLIIFITMMLTLRVIKEVNLLGAVRYMWTLYWLLPVDIFLVTALIDYHGVTWVWINHWWHVGAMEWVRELFCPAGTANSKCMVPIMGGANFTSEEEWCQFFHNDTDCEDIREDAQAEAGALGVVFYTANLIWAILLILLLLMTMNVLQGIITPPIVQASKAANIPAWLTLPIAGCLSLGLGLIFSSPFTLTTPSDESIGSVNWLGTGYLVAGGTFTISALLGWFISVFSVKNRQDKRRKTIAVIIFISTMFLSIIVVGAIFITSLIFSVNVVSLPLSDDERGSIACDYDTAGSCTNCCHDCENKCPEWSKEDVVNVTRTALKQSAALAAIFLLYGISALRFGFALRTHILNYHIDYV